MQSEGKILNNNNNNNNNNLFSLLPLLPHSVFHDRNSHIHKLQELKSYNWRPDMHHGTVRVTNNDNNNNYTPICKEASKLTNFSIQCCHITWQKNERLERWINRFSLQLILHRFKFRLRGCHMTNERLKPEDSRDELINYLSSSYCIGLSFVYGAVTWWANDSTPKTC